MPIIFQQNINNSSIVGVWHITECEDWFRKFVPPGKNINHPHKRLQHLAARKLLADLSPGLSVAEILIHENGKPFLPNEPIHFSVSHCGNYAATIISESKCGIDAELISEKVLRMVPKFLSDNEKVFIKQEKMLAATCWSIKEAAYKWYGLGKVDFREHMKIQSVSIEQGKITANLEWKKDFRQALQISGVLIDQLVVCWINQDQSSSSS